jgi:sugar (pentulose or hexulose) kinase
MNYLAFDLGASSGKLMKASFNGGRISLAEIMRFENGPIPIGEGLYWGITGIYHRVLQGLRKAAGEGPYYSLGIDSFSNDFGFIDRHGDLLTPVRCYRDNRTIRYGSYVYDRISKQRLYELTGNQNARFNTLMQLGAMKAAGQEWILDNSFKLLFIPDLLAYFLSGEPAAEYTIASVSQLFSFAENDFCGEILRTLGLRRDLFGSVVMPGTGIGNIRSGLIREQGLPPCKVLAACEHDTASAYLASPFNRTDVLLISSGTWALMGCETESPLITGETYARNIANEGGYPGHHRFLKNVMGSWLIQETRSAYCSEGREYSYAGLEYEAGKAKPFGWFIDVDDDLFFSPGKMPEKIREDCKKRYGAAPEDTGSLVRCIYESIVMKYRRNLEILEKAAHRNFGVINILGGGAKDSLMCRFTANACKRPVAAGPRDAAILGNILVQLISAGEAASVEEGRDMLAASFPPVWYEPEENDHWEEGYGRYCESFPG